MYKVLGKDIIENEIIVHLLAAKRRFKTKSCLVEVIKSIVGNHYDLYQSAKNHIYKRVIFILKWAVNITIKSLVLKKT